MSGPSAMDSLRSDLRLLHERHKRGDVRERDFKRKVAELSVDLYRLAARTRMDSDETILAEHHVVHAHLKLAESVLKEPDEEAVSLFASDKRLVRVRGILAPGRPVSCNEEDATEIDEVAYGNIHSLAKAREVRKAEILTGAVIVAIALLFHSYLLITGTVLVLLGGAGILHGLLLPTRWIRIVTDEEDGPKPFVIVGLSKKSAKNLLAVVRQRMATPQKE